jgi:hypothetical protein
VHNEIFTGPFKLAVDSLQNNEGKKTRKIRRNLTFFISVIFSSVLGIPRDANKATGNNDVVLLSIDDSTSSDRLERNSGDMWGIDIYQ